MPSGMQLTAPAPVATMRRAWAPVFVLIAGAGTVALVLTVGAGRPVWGLTQSWELQVHLISARAILSGTLHDAYRNTVNAYAPPYMLVALPLAALSDPAAAVVGRCLVALALFV